MLKYAVMVEPNSNVNERDSNFPKITEPRLNKLNNITNIYKYNLKQTSARTSTGVRFFKAYLQTCRDH